MKDFPGLYRQRGRIYWFARQVGGKRTFQSLGTADLAEAIVKAQALLADPVVGGGELMADMNRFLETMERTGKYSRDTLANRRTILELFATFAAGIGTKDITTRVVQKFYDERMATGISASTGHSYMMMLRAFFTWCTEKPQRIRSDHPCDGVVMEKVESKGRKDFLSREQVRLLIKNCPRDDLKFVFYCGFHAGLRKQEIVEAKAFWFDLKAKLLHLRKHAGIQFKDREERTIPMTDEFVKFMKHFGLAEPYVLHPEKVRRKNRYRWDFDRPFDEYVAAQLPGVPITPHVMRHTFASLLASQKNGPSIYEIAVWLGDEVRTTQKHYAKLRPDNRAINRAF